MREINWEQRAARVICFAALAVAVYFGIRVAFGYLLPFVLAWGLSLCITPLSRGIARRFHLPKGLCAAVLLTAALCGTLFLVGLGVNRLLTELERLLTGLTDRGFFDSPDYYSMLAERLPFLRRPAPAEREELLRERVNLAVGEWIGGFLEALQEKVPQWIGKFVSALPSVLLFAVVTVISGFYFCMDRKGIEQGLITCLPSSVRCHLPQWGERLKQFSSRYLRAYLILLLLTLAALFVGLLILDVDYALLIATVTAAVDLLPVLGVGTVLIPWSVVALLQRDYRLGVGLLILYLAVTILHQILEPRLVGKSLGLHPLLTLAAGYIGFRMLGITGMLLAPPVTLLLRELLCRPRGE